MRFKTRETGGALLDVDFLGPPVKDQIAIVHNVYALVLDPAGRLLWVSRGRNKVTNIGLNVLRDMLAGTGFRPTHIAIGSGTNAPGAGDSALQTEFYRQKIDRRIPEPSKMTFQIILGTGDQNGQTFREVGIFEGTSTSGGNKLIARSLLSPVIAKTSSFQVTLAHEITLVAL